MRPSIASLGIAAAIGAQGADRRSHRQRRVEWQNQGPTERRAQSVQVGLTQRGVQRSQITALGKGENFPISGNDTADGRQSNRRVELIFNDGETRTASDAGP